MAPSVPRAKTYITPLVGEVAAGDEVSFPPRDSQPDHDRAVTRFMPQGAVSTVYKDVKTAC